jgi:hypothetical protein
MSVAQPIIIKLSNKLYGTKFPLTKVHSLMTSISFFPFIEPKYS